MSSYVRVVDNVDEFDNLKMAWEKIHSLSGNASIFSSFEWLRTWWDFYSDNHKLFILLLYENDNLFGISPFILTAKKHRSGITARYLQFLGTGEPQHEEVNSELIDIISLPGYETKASDLTATFLLKCKHLWDISLFKDIRDDFLVNEKLKRFLGLRSILKPALTPAGLEYVIDLPRTWGEYLNSLRKNSRKRLEYQERTLQRVTDVKFHLLSDKEQIDYMFSELKRLHDIRWAESGEGAFSSQRNVDFHKKAIERLFEKGKAWIRIISINGRNVVASYNLEHNGTTYFYQIGRDVAPNNKIKYGTIDNMVTIKDSISKGNKTFDFLKSTPDAYKLDYGCKTIPMYNLEIYNKSMKGRLVWLFEKIRPLLGRIQRSIKS